MKKRLLADIAERVIWTFIQGAAATLMLSGFLDIEAWKAAAVGGVAAVLALVKGTAASQIGSPISAATLPKTLETTGTLATDVVGEVSEVVDEAVDDAMTILDKIEDKAAKSPTKPKRTIRKKAT
jgi:hypothetical protein